MRRLALVLVITLSGCVPMPNKGAAYAGDAAWLTASAYAFISAENRRCEYMSNDPDPWGAGLDELLVNGACDAGKDLEMKIAEMVMVAAVGGVVRTLINTYQGPATPKTSRSR